MFLVSADAVSDTVQQDALNIVRKSSNAILAECLQAAPDLAAIAKAALERFCGKIIFVSHGGPSGLFGGIGRYQYLGTADVDTFLNCQICAFACCSAQHLGRFAVAYAFIYIGFDSTIGTPDPSSEALDDYIQCLRKILSFFHTLKNGSVDRLTVEYFFRDLVEQLESVEASFENDDGSRLGAHDLICLKNLRNDLCVWLRGCSLPCKAEGAPDLSLLWV